MTRLLQLLAGELDTVVFVASLASLSYGAALVYVPAGFIVPGLIGLYWTLPVRPPFMVPLTKRKESS